MSNYTNKDRALIALSTLYGEIFSIASLVIALILILQQPGNQIPAKLCILSIHGICIYLYGIIAKWCMDAEHKRTIYILHDCIIVLFIVLFVLKLLPFYICFGCLPPLIVWLVINR